MYMCVARNGRIYMCTYMYMDTIESLIIVRLDKMKIHLLF